MSKYLLKISCPCCRKPIEVDTRNGKARSLELAEGDKADQFDQLVDQHRQEETRLDDVFSQAAQSEQQQTERFDDLFQSSLDEARKDEDERPRNPFDLD